jgi:sialate O-acetylesterase
VLVGEVWVCSGQSNMEWSVKQSKDAEQEIAAANHPTIRLFDVPNTTAAEPLADTKAKWTPCTPQTVAPFSAVAYYFGRELSRQLKVPVGLVHTSWGGTPAEAWTSAEYLAKDPELAGLLAAAEKRAADYPKQQENHEKAVAKWKEAAAQAKADGKPVPPQPRAPSAPDKDPNRPATLYNGMIAPVVPFAARGRSGTRARATPAGRTSTASCSRR